MIRKGRNRFMLRMIVLYLILSFVQCAVAADRSFSPQEVFSKSGNIYYSKGNETVRLTASGRDHSPVLSFDKKIIAFIREGRQVIPKGCADFANTDSAYGNQIWIYDLEEKKEWLLVANNFRCDEPTQTIVDPNDLHFSPDNKVLYFITQAWITSGALHAINVDSGRQRFVIPANSIEVVPKGEYKGYLIVQQHLYFIGGGSYDWFWLFTPEGKKVGPIGDEVSRSQREFLEWRETGVTH